MGKHWTFQTQVGDVFDKDGVHRGWEDYLMLSLTPREAIQTISAISRWLEDMQWIYDTEERIDLYYAGKLEESTD